MCWPQCALCGCAALKSAHLTSPQTVSATVQNNKPKSELFLFFSTADAVDGGQDRARLICLEPGREVGQVAVNDASSRSSVFLRWFLLAIGGLPGGFPPPLAVYAEVFHRAGRLLGRSRRFLGCRMRVAASAERTVSSIGIANRRTRS